jgi:hypothetical protein
MQPPAKTFKRTECRKSMKKLIKTFLVGTILVGLFAVSNADLTTNELASDKPIGPLVSTNQC